MADPWSYSTGEYGVRVRVFERRPGGNLYISVPDASYSSGYRVTSLKHTDRKKAKSRAHRVVSELSEGRSRLRRGEATLGEILDLYKRHETSAKGESATTDDLRRIPMWKRWLGAGTRPDRISTADWNAFARKRTSGEIDSYARPVRDEDDREPVSPNTTRRDMQWLGWVLDWAAGWKTSDGGYLLSENPIRGQGYRLPEKRTPRRPVASRERMEKTLAKASEVGTRIGWGGDHEYRPCYLGPLLRVVAGTGRRIRAVLQLRWENVRLEASEHAPHGAIRWPHETDKEGEAWSAPITADVRRALEEMRQLRAGVGRAHVFPSPQDPSKPLSKPTADRWLLKAERKAGLEPLDGGRFHPYRRKWATERKHLPDVDVARAGGWKDPATMQKCYQQADESSVLEVVLNPRELRERKRGS